MTFSDFLYLEYWDFKQIIKLIDTLEDIFIFLYKEDK